MYGFKWIIVFVGVRFQVILDNGDKNEMKILDMMREEVGP